MPLLHWIPESTLKILTGGSLRGSEMIIKVIIDLNTYGQVLLIRFFFNPQHNPTREILGLLFYSEGKQHSGQTSNLSKVT